MTEKKITSYEDVETLKAQVAELQAQLVQQASESEEAARRAMFFRQDNEEVPTGDTVKVHKCTGYEITGYTDDGQPRRKPVWEEVDQPTFLYKVDLPPVGGAFVMLNGQEFYHGSTYTLSLDDLRTVKEIVFRIRQHEANIHGTDENAYRPKTNAHFSGKANGRVH